MLTQERLKEVLDYDPETGLFVWRIKNREINDANRLGYVVITVDSKPYGAHRLAWLYVHGYLSENRIDHRDRIRHHNWISNLREASPSCNGLNAKVSKSNKSGVKGINWIKDGQKWLAQIKVQRERIIVYRGFSFDDAVKARYQAELKYECAGDNSSAYQYLIKNDLI